MGILKEKRTGIKSPKIIACLSQKGGGGKSTLARALAVELTKQKLNILLVDLDIQQKTSQEWSERRKQQNIKPTVNCQSFPYFPLELLKKNYDYLIIDAPARISQESLTIAKQANLIIRPVRPSLDDLNPAIREFNGLFKAGIPKSKLNFVINAVGSRAMEKATRDYLVPAEYYIFPIALEEKVSYQEAQNQGLSIGEVKYKRLQEQVKKLVKEILKKC
ncbi:AAA family ATPase [endosymbiont GvMRE of Glomus versiforme]|uniref:AAA family ATPase n=1 Tax=endosymbiont GvMRE of Glomus versiforme TaxID=2039283 RepID=UPI000EBE27C4|nr:AAA family ATPase [endosymbiont GvMRE of Glomus versiforme]RHZ37162.1 ParA-like plasmid partition protein [endosymbiont GvMRE of Glomus versiforme]